MKVVKQDIKLREESLVHVETLVKTSLMSLEDKRGKSSVKGNKSKSKSPYIGKSNSRGTGLNVDTPLPPPPPPLNTEQLEPRLSPPMGYLPTVPPSHRLPSNTCHLYVDQAFVEAYPFMNDNVNNAVESVKNLQRIECYTESNVVQVNEVNCED